MKPPQTTRCHAAVAWSPSRPLCMWNSFNLSKVANNFSLSLTGILWRHAAIEEIEVGPPRRGEVRIKLTATGICHTDAYTYCTPCLSHKFPKYKAQS